MPYPPRSPYFASVVGPPEFERYALRRNFFGTLEYYTGSVTEPWTEEPRKARLYAHPGDLGQELHGVARLELAHLPQRTYRLEVEVLAIGDATPEEVRDYLAGALTIGVDDDIPGPGPGLGSLVLVKADLGSLRADGDVQQDPKFT